MTDSLIVGITGFFNLILGGFVLARNPKSPIHKLFAVFSISLITWTSFNFLADQASAHNLWFTRLTFVGAVLIAITLFQLSNVFPTGKSISNKKFVLTEAALGLIIAIISLTPLLVPEVTKKPEGGVELEVGPLYIIYILYIVHILVLIIYNFIRHIKIASVMEKAQIKLLLMGVILYAVFAIASNLLLPLFVDNWSSSRFGPVFTLLFVAFTAYAIVRHRLFDIRLIVARSVGYILSLAFLGVLYGFITFYLFDKILFDSAAQIPSTRRLVYIVLALLSGLAFTPAKRVFDRVSNKIFYRDAYDPQAFIDDLTGVLVSNTDMTKLLGDSSQLISKHMKPIFIDFAIADERYKGGRQFGKVAEQLTALQLEELFAAVNSEPHNVTEIEEGGTAHRTSLSYLHRKGVAITIRLTSRDKLLGVVLVGSKQSGNIYNRQDIEVFEIVADELSLALENSLSYEEIQHFAETLQEEVDDATRRLRYTNNKLRALDETKDEFISMASHQLRTPLTSVKGYLSMVLDGDVGELNEQQKKMLAQAFSSSQRMNYLITDLLNVSRLRTGKFVIEKTVVDLSKIIDEEIGQLHEIAHSKSIALHYDKPSDFPTLELDETKTRQVIMNFVDNALHYTPSGGEVRVELEAKGKSIELRVVDNGLGVPRSDQHKLFGKFFRAGNARRVRPDGTGLGLFMAKKVIIAQGGAIIFKSAEGKGSTFGFTFPR